MDYNLERIGGFLKTVLVETSDANINKTNPRFNCSYLQLYVTICRICGLDYSDLSGTGLDEEKEDYIPSIELTQEDIDYLMSPLLRYKTMTDSDPELYLEWPDILQEFLQDKKCLNSEYEEWHFNHYEDIVKSFRWGHQWVRWVVRGRGVQDVERLTGLWKLDCNNNQLRELDVSHNIALESISCANNQLEQLNVTNNRALVHLYCNSNELQQLDVTNNHALIKLWCNSNELQQLNVTNNRALIDLYCDHNQLQQLDVANNHALQTLNCGSNQLQHLDVADNRDLRTLYCDSNQLQHLDVTNNRDLRTLNCGSNQLQQLNVANNRDLQILKNMVICNVKFA